MFIGIGPVRASAARIPTDIRGDGESYPGTWALRTDETPRYQRDHLEVCAPVRPCKSGRP